LVHGRGEQEKHTHTHASVTLPSVSMSSKCPSLTLRVVPSTWTKLRSSALASPSAIVYCDGERSGEKNERYWRNQGDTRFTGAIKITPPPPRKRLVRGRAVHHPQHVGPPAHTHTRARKIPSSSSWLFFSLPSEGFAARSCKAEKKKLHPATRGLHSRSWFRSRWRAASALRQIGKVRFALWAKHAAVNKK